MVGRKIEGPSPRTQSSIALGVEDRQQLRLKDLDRLMGDVSRKDCVGTSTFKDDRGMIRRMPRRRVDS